MPNEGENEGHCPARPSLLGIVAIPVCNEVDRIGACLRALQSQIGVEPGTFGVVLFLNNCTDGTACEIEAFRGTMCFPLRVVSRDFTGANAGWARRMAIDRAAEWLETERVSNGVILTTDADSRVPPDWIVRNLAALHAGADAVAGRIDFDPDEVALLPSPHHARVCLEAQYERLLLELAARLAPEAHDPWPNHWTASGASLAVRLDAYRRVDGLPDIALGEDRAFVERLRSFGMRVRHDPDIVVVTSGRLQGRAPGGAADTIRRRCEDPDSACDYQLEPLGRALARFLWRRLARRRLIGRFLERAKLTRIFAFKPLRPRALPAQIGRARLLLALLQWLSRSRDAAAFSFDALVRASSLQAPSLQASLLQMSSLRLWRAPSSDSVALSLSDEGTKAAGGISAPASL